MTLFALVSALLVGVIGLTFGYVLGRRAQRPDGASGGGAGSDLTLTQVVPEHLPEPELQYQFMGKVAHALRNPLTGVLMSAELLQEEEDPQYIRQALDRILEQGRQIKEIITRIQEATALDACQFQLEIEAVELGPALLEAVEVYAPRARSKGQEILLKDVPLDARVVGDRRFLASVLGEMLSNAIKYSPKAGQVRLGAEPSEYGYRCWVEDDGPGISPSDQHQLFQRFAKLSASPTAGESHIGLGLWSARMMAETLGGQLYYETREGRGARFVLELLKAYAFTSTNTA